MNIPFSERLTALCDGRAGLRTVVQVNAREASPPPHAAAGSAAANGEALLPGSDNPCLDFVASNDTLDRFHEIIEPSGWRLDNYRKNPVFQNAHNYGDVIFTLGKALVTEVRPTGLEGPAGAGLCLFQRIQFATDVNPMARIAYGLYKGGFLNAVSVGFIPLRWQDGDGARGSGASRQNVGEDLRFKSADRGKPVSAQQRFQTHCQPHPPTGTALHNLAAIRSETSARRRYLEQELLEVSAVAVPGNPDALALGLKSGAIGKGDLQEAVDLLRQLVRAGTVPFISPLTLFAHELHRVLRRA